MGDPGVLYQDLLENPSKYEDAVLPLVQSLVTEQRALHELSDEEMRSLDRATLDFSQPARQTAPPEPVAPPAPRRGESDVVYQDPDVKSPFPDGKPDAFWWLNT